MPSPARTLPRRYLAAIALSMAAAATTLPAQAARPAGAFSAQLTAPVSEPRRELLGEQVWRCAGDSCSARFDGSHPQRTCARVVQVFGPVVRFASPAGELSGEQLARCNGAK